MKHLSCHGQKVPGPGFLPGCSLFPLLVLPLAPSPPAPGHGISAVFPARPFPPVGIASRCFPMEKQLFLGYSPMERADDLPN